MWMMLGKPEEVSSENCESRGARPLFFIPGSWLRIEQGVFSVESFAHLFDRLRERSALIAVESLRHFRRRERRLGKEAEVGSKTKIVRQTQDRGQLFGPPLFRALVMLENRLSDLRIDVPRVEKREPDKSVVERLNLLFLCHQRQLLFLNFFQNLFEPRRVAMAKDHLADVVQ
jgi:hypothetical protein